MVGDRSLPPSPRRELRARRAGLRPRSRWLWLGLALLTLAWLGPVWGAALQAWAGGWWAAAAAGVAPPSPGFSVLVGVLGVPVALLAAVAAAHGLSGAMGSISGAARAGLGARPVRAWMPLTLLTGLGLVLLLMLVLPAVAGGARAVDATGPALGRLWQTWFMRGAAQVGAVLVGLGLLETWVMRRAIRDALHLTPEEARNERREAGRG